MSGRDIIAIGGSAGAVEGLTRIVAGLPADLAAAVFVVVHFPTRWWSSPPPPPLARRLPCPTGSLRKPSSRS